MSFTEANYKKELFFIVMSALSLVFPREKTSFGDHETAKRQGKARQGKARQGKARQDK
jgi:hypothetical protein